MKKNNNVPFQIYNRLVEQKSTVQSDTYKFVKTKNFYLSSIAPDNFYLVQKLFFKLISISRSAGNEFVLHGLRIQDLHNLHQKLYASTPDIFVPLIADHVAEQFQLQRRPH